jgi:hypothetical protein
LNAALDELQAVMFNWLPERTSVIKPILRRGSGLTWWRVQLVEETDDHGRTQWYNQQLDERVVWVEKQLKSWPHCKRMAWDMWDFKHRQDAEKFITLYHLSWAR